MFATSHLQDVPSEPPSVLALPICTPVNDDPRRTQFMQRLTATLVITSIMLPGLLAAGTVSAYLAGASPIAAVTVGILIGGILWLTSAFLCRSMVGPERANLRSYGELQQRLSHLDARVTALRDLREDAATAMKEVETQRDALVSDFAAGGLSWALGTGYINAWNRMHRAEEALIEVDSPSAVIAGAVHDELRLQGSSIDNSNNLLAKLRLAVEELDGSAKRYFIKEPPIEGPAADQSGLSPVATSSGQSAEPGAGLEPHRESLARAVLREVRRSINEFRDDRWDALVRARNHLLGAVLFTGATAYVLLGVAVLGGSSHKGIVAASAFYLVGAVIGLVNRLRADSENETAVEDYGLSWTRLVGTPLLSGLAAVGGVVLIAMIPFANNLTPSHPAALPTSTTTTPTETTPPTDVAAPSTKTTGSETPTGAVSLDAIFDLHKNVLGLLFAALFGLTPSALITRLQKQAETYKEDLQNSEASQESKSEKK